jgi:hypothetical protein
MAPTAHATTWFNNYSSSTCRDSGGVDRTAARDICNFRVSSTRGMKLKEIDRGCVSKLYPFLSDKRGFRCSTVFLADSLYLQCEAGRLITARVQQG